MQAKFIKGVAAALAGAVLWGFSGNCIQLLVANDTITPLFITMVRSVVAGCALIAFSLIRYRSVIQEMICDRGALCRVLLFGCALWASQVTYAISVEQTNAGTATVLQSLATVFVMLFACASARRLPKGLQLIGLICALISTWLIATQGDPMALALPASGILWGLVNALSVAIYLICPAKLYDRWPSLPVISCALGMSALCSVLGFVGVGACSEGAIAPVLSASDVVLLVVGIGLLGTAAAFGLYLSGVAIVGSVNGSLLGTAEPASAKIIMALWLGTSVSAADWTGLILMIAMIATVALSSRSS